MSPIHVYVQSIKLSYIELKIKIKNKENQSLMEEREKIKRALNMHIKLELGLETVYQLGGQIILLVLAYTETPTQIGLGAMFAEVEDWRDQILLIGSILLSFNSCITSHWKALTACREYFPLKSKVVSALFCLLGCLTRVTAIVMYFAGPLGLFSLLRHLQGERYPWNEKILTLVNPDGSMVLGNSPPFMWATVDRSYENSSTPNYILYIGMGLRYYLLMFFVGIGIHTMVIFIAKSERNPEIWRKMNFLDKIIHSIENANVPYNIKEWDDGKGDANEHKKRMQSNWFEVRSIIIINGVFNTFFLLPLAYLGACLSNLYILLKETLYFIADPFSLEDARTAHNSLSNNWIPGQRAGSFDKRLLHVNWIFHCNICRDNPASSYVLDVQRKMSPIC